MGVGIPDNRRVFTFESHLKGPFDGTPFGQDSSEKAGDNFVLRFQETIVDGCQENHRKKRSNGHRIASHGQATPSSFA